MIMTAPQCLQTKRGLSSAMSTAVSSVAVGVGFGCPSSVHANAMLALWQPLASSP